MADEAKKDEDQQQEAPGDSGAAAAAPARAPAGFRHVIGEKKGMTQIYDGQGNLRGVTVIQAGPCVVSGLRTPEKDGYSAVQLAFGQRKEKSFNKAQLGQFKAAGVKPAKALREFRLSDVKGFAVGQLVDLESRFKPLDYVDVRGVTKGKGFQGVMKRHNFRGMPGSHGASDKERSPGSLTSRRSLGKVLKGQRMAGHMGDVMSSVQKIEVVQVDPENNLLYVNGPVPGAAGSVVLVGETVKDKKARIIRKASTVLRDKMGNIIQAKGAKAAAKAQAKPAK
ncbi:MAG: 50S ribosomal protein L3 [Elusimicrobia bacterium]|nr:50S ribosomal protein L3 [Elusimicrobiota bacterium]